MTNTPIAPSLQEKAPTLAASLAPSHAMAPTQDGTVSAAGIMRVALDTNARDVISAAPDGIGSKKNADIDPIFKKYTAPDEFAKSGKGKQWWESPQGRVGTRIFSRGVMGSLLYAMASISAEKALVNYNPDVAINDALVYEKNNKFIHQFVRGLARTIDLTLAPAIRKTTSLFTNNAERIHGITLFRPSREWGVSGQLGRSLGHEMTDVTFNFAAASFGDALGRNFAQMIDPNKEITWLKDGKFNAEQFAVSQARALWKIVTYNSGEDFFAALPYVYSMKLQRKMINDTSWGQGFAHVFDNGNAAAYKVNETGQVTGNYYWQNMLDYQLRFTNYNILTLMYREMYNTLGHRIKEWEDTGKTPVVPMPHSFGEAMHSLGQECSNLAAYLARSVVKGYILMTPTVPFFSFFRAAQGNANALSIHPEHGPMMVDGEHSKNGAPYIMKPNFREGLSNEARFTDGRNLYTQQGDHLAPMAGNPTLKLRFRDGFGLNTINQNPYITSFSPEQGIALHDPFANPPMGKGAFYRASNAAGKASYDFSRKAYDWLVDLRYGLDTTRSNGPAPNREFQQMMLSHINSAISYTPYFAAKTEFAELWDNTKTDQAIDKMFSGVAHLNGGRFLAGVADTFDAIVHPGTSTGLGSVYGSDTNNNAGWTPWSKRVSGVEHDRQSLSQVAAESVASAIESGVKEGTFVPLNEVKTVEKRSDRATASSWRDRSAQQTKERASISNGIAS